MYRGGGGFGLGGPPMLGGGQFGGQNHGYDFNDGGGRGGYGGPPRGMMHGRGGGGGMPYQPMNNRGNFNDGYGAPMGHRMPYDDRYGGRGGGGGGGPPTTFRYNTPQIREQYNEAPSEEMNFSYGQPPVHVVASERMDCDEFYDDGASTQDYGGGHNSLLAAALNDADAMADDGPPPAQRRRLMSGEATNDPILLPEFDAQGGGNVNEMLANRFGQAPPKEVGNIFGDQARKQPGGGNTNLSMFDKHLVQSMGVDDHDFDGNSAPLGQRDLPSGPLDRERLLALVGESKEYEEERRMNEIRRRAKEKEWLEGPRTFSSTFVPGYALALFDKAYENSIWDYDTKFTWDYLPDTKRGTKPPPKDLFVMGTDYINEEHKWKAFEGTYNKMWRDTYVPKVIAQASRGDGGDAVLDIRHVLASEQPSDKAIAWFEEHMGVPEDLCTTQYCGICEREFKSVMPSIRHYLEPEERHEEYVRQYYIESLCDGGHLCWDDVDSPYAKGVISRMLKIYRTKPKEWLCVICNSNITSVSAANTHFKGGNHQKKLKALMDVKSQMMNPTKQRTATQKLKLQLKMRGRGGMGMRGGGHNQRVAWSMMNTKANRGGLGASARAGATVLIPGELSRARNNYSVHTAGQQQQQHQQQQQQQQPSRIMHIDERQSGAGTAQRQEAHGMTTYGFISSNDPSMSNPRGGYARGGGRGGGWGRGGSMMPQTEEARKAMEDRKIARLREKAKIFDEKKREERDRLRALLKAPMQLF